MFLVKDERQGSTYLVFTWEDPRKDGFIGEVIEGVSLDYDVNAVHRHSDGHIRPEGCVGQAAENPKQHKVFKYTSELQPAGYHPIAGTAHVFGSYSEYAEY